MASTTTNFAFSRFFGLGLLLMGCWNVHLLRLLNGWTAIDLLHVSLAIGGVIALGAVLLFRARAIQRSAPSEVRSDLASVRKTLNALFLVALSAIVLGDVMTLVDYAAKVSKLPGGTISEQALVVKDTTIARVVSFSALATYLVIGMRKRPS